MAAEGASSGLGSPAVHVSSAADFLRWWKEELLAQLPAAWRDRLQAGSAVPVVADGSGWRRYALAQGVLVEDAAAQGGGPLTRELKGANVWLLLGPDEALARNTSLPLAAQGALREAIGFDLDRLTPFSAEHAYFGYQLASQREADGTLTVRLAVARQDLVEGRVAALRDAGARVLGVGLLEEYAGGANSLNLLPPEQRDRPGVAKELVAAKALGSLAVVLAIAALVYPVWLKRESVIALLPEVDQARAAAEISNRLTREIEALVSKHNFLLSKKHLQPAVAPMLEELSSRLPDNTWVQQLEVKMTGKSPELRLSGETGSSSALVETLERSGSFENATFVSPLTKGTGAGMERYVLSAQLKERELPAPLPNEALTTAGAAPPPPAPGPQRVEGAP